ncbi:esterase-like activity of phytase family protein [Sutterella faecalis]|uniref:Esterase-like activity of phytase family protein n=1 Tax=Sutterella faecalis TaxID=2584944 RepID=A0ABX5VBA8_9BURK|nr:esterase-like activity of phytase family protein [Sutterella faecalis]QDA53566.1 esterase-like activity of phytase family protein [Sutterella faecalis]
MPEIKTVPQEEAENRLPEGIEKIERFAVEVPQLTLPSGTAGKAPLPEGLFPMSVGCSLAFSSERTDGTLLFYGLTDRGPTLPAPSVRDGSGALRPARYFLSPMFQPRIVRIEVTAGKARSLSPVALTNAEAKPFSGLPARADDGAKPFAILSLANEELSGSLRPIDPEGLAIDPESAFWVVDRYGPALRQFSRQGVEREVLFPGAGLPAFLAARPGSLRSLSRASRTGGS